jgi:hypothetical protein
MSNPTRFVLALALSGSIAACSQKDGATPDDTSAACTAPSLSSTSDDQSVTLGAMVQVTAEGTVCGTSEATYVWAVESVPMESGIDTGDLDLTDPASPTFVPDKVGTYVLSVHVVDADSARSPAEYVVIEVGSGNSAPMADCGANRTAQEGERVTLDGTGSRDPEGARLEYAWTLASAPGCSVRSGLLLRDGRGRQPRAHRRCGHDVDAVAVHGADLPAQRVRKLRPRRTAHPVPLDAVERAGGLRSLRRELR